VATRSLQLTGAGTISSPPKIKLGFEGTLEDKAVAALNEFNAVVARKLNGGLSFGDGSQSSRTGNIYGQWVEFITPDPGGTQFTIDHGLRKNIIGRLIMRQNKAGQLYDVNLGGWGPTKVYFMCDTASVLMKVALLCDPDS
jgi:hypothetical protein